MAAKLKTRVFYGWYMVAGGAIVQLLAGGLLSLSFGAYAVLLQREFNWSKTSISAAFSLLRFESGLLGPVEGWLVDRFGPRAIMRAGLLIFGIGFLLFSQIDSLPTFYVTFVIIAVGASMGGFLPLAVAVVNWFRRRRAMALATMQTGMALGGLAVPIVIFSLESIGWRLTALASGILIIAVGLPIAQIIRHRPEDYGFEPDGGPGRAKETSDNPDVPSATQIDFLASEAIRTPAFWLVSLGHGSALLVVSAVQLHLVPHLHEHLGYSLEAAGLQVSLLAVMQITGQLLGGFLGDRINKRAIAVVCMGMHAIGLLLLAYATSLAMVLAFTLLHGLAWGLRGPLMQAIRADYFGRASFGAIMGWSSVITTVGNSSGPLVAGFMADTFGNYEAGFTLLAILSGLGSIFFVLASPPSPPARLTRNPQPSAAAPDAG